MEQLSTGEDPFANFWAAFAMRGSHLLWLDDSGSAGYAETFRTICELSRALAGSGLTPGDRIALCASAIPHGLLLTWAAWMAGLVVVPINIALPPKAKKLLAQFTEVAAVFADPQRLDSFGPQIPCFALAGQTIEQAMRGPVVDGLPNSQATTRKFCADAFAPDAPAAILFTSGTTGSPKGVVLSRRALRESGSAMSAHYGWTPLDRYLLLGDCLHTISGLRNPALAVPDAGATLVLRDRETTASLFRIVEATAASGCTLISSIPAFYRQLCLFHDRLPTGWQARVRQFLSTGCNLDLELARRCHDLFGLTPCDYYGLTETCGISVATPPGQVKPGSGYIGLPVGAQARIIGNGRICPPGQPGELWISSTRLMSGYFKRADLTAERLADGWLRTGDLAVMDNDGRLWLRDRIADIIKTPQCDILCPSELEELLRRCEAVLDAGVCGFTDASGAERPAAFIVAVREADAKAVTNTLRLLVTEHLGAQAMPSVFTFVRALPRGENGKLSRATLRDLLLKEQA